MTNDNMIGYRCKISGGRILELHLPAKLTKEDVERINVFIESQTDDGYESEEPIIPLKGWNEDHIGRITAALALPSTASGEEVATALRALTRRCEELEHKLLAFQENAKV